MTETTEEDAKPVGQPHWRQLDILAPEHLRVPFVIIGGGAIGSIIALALAKMGAPDITVFDFDKVEDHNWPNQYYGPADIDRPKVEALQELVYRQSGIRIKAVNERFENQKLGGIVISAVDKMSVRAHIWKAVELKPAVKLFIDARMGGLVGNIYAIRPIDANDRAFFKETLYSDEQAQELKCTERAIIFNVMGIDAYVAAIIRAFAEHARFPRMILLDLKNFQSIFDFKR